MNSLKNLYVLSFLLLGFGSAAQAIPVTFSYASKTIDWSTLKPWQADYMAASMYKWNLWEPKLMAGLQLEVECDVQADAVRCASLLEPVAAGPAFNKSLKADVLKLTGLSGFTDPFVIASRFRVGQDGTVQEWEVEGAEYGKVGDFKLSDTGDSWAYAGFADMPEMNYCQFAHEATHDLRNGVCSNGAEIEQLFLTLELGLGTWTSNLAELRAVEAVPLPAGLLLAFGGFGLLGALRLGQRGAAASSDA